jgi:hypothetical protein
LGNVLGNNAVKQLGSVSIKQLNASAAIHGNVGITARPEILREWRIDPKLAAQVTLGREQPHHRRRESRGARAGQAADRQDRQRADGVCCSSACATTARLNKMRGANGRNSAARLHCRRPLTGMPVLWLEMRPVRAMAAQPRIDANWVSFTLGLQAETRVLPAETKPDCPFPATLDIMPPPERGRVNIGVPIDLPFTEVNKIVELQLKGRKFPEDGSGSVDVTVKSANVAAAGQRLLISLLVNAKEKKSFLGLGGEATIHIWGRPVLDQAQQILRLTDLELAVESDSAFGLLGAAARPAVPYLQRALEQRATIDLKTFAANAQQKISSIVADMRTSDQGIRVDASVSSVRLGSIAFDSSTLRIIAEAEGAIGVSVTALPNLQP